LPYYGTCTTEYNEGFKDGIKWLKGQMSKWGYVLQRQVYVIGLLFANWNIYLVRLMYGGIYT
jgi:hypothetical protein